MEIWKNKRSTKKGGQKPIKINSKLQIRCLETSNKIALLSAEQNGILAAILYLNDVDNLAGWRVTSDFSQLLPPLENKND